MVTLRFLTCIALFLLLTSCSSTPSSIERSARIVVTGVGTNLGDAKLDAIRSALARKIPQYVVVDRKVVNDDLLRDLTVSTMSGYITYIEIIDQFVDKNGFVTITVLIEVRKNKVRDYASRFESQHFGGGGDRLDGQSIAKRVLDAKAKLEAETVRKEEQWRSSIQLTSRLFAGYPTGVTAVNVTSINFEPLTPDLVVLELSYDLNEEWRKSFWKKVELIDALMTDSGPRANVEICPLSGTLLDSCKRLPSNDNGFDIWASSNINHNIFIPIFSSKGAYMTCLKRSLDIPMLSGTRYGAPVSIKDIGVGATMLTGAIASLPFLVVGGIISGVTNDQPEKEVWPMPDNTLYVQGPNPSAIDLSSGTQAPIVTSISVNSDILFNKKYAAEFYEPFVAASTGEDVFILDSTESRSANSWEELCRVEGMLRR